MTRTYAAAALVFAFALRAAPASAAAFVQDGAGMFSAGVANRLDAEISAFNAQTGKEVVVVTVPSLNGETVSTAAQQVFSEQRINGVLIFIAKSDRRDIIVPGTATARFFPPATLVSIRTAMESQFRDGDFNGGITTAVNGVLNVFRAHIDSAVPSRGYQRSYAYPARTATASSGVHLPIIMWILLIIVAYLVIRSIFRAMAMRSYGPGAPGAGGPPAVGPGYGGYGPGYGYGGGGGFWSGLLGGLGGAWLGNELFGGGMMGGGMMGGNTMGGDVGGGFGGASDAGAGWGNDAGQADMGSASAGGFSGGGFGDAGGGFGDMGGGFGDMGGGW